MAEDSSPMVPLLLLLIACCAVSSCSSCATAAAWYFNIDGLGEIEGLPRSPQAEPVTEAPSSSF